MLLQNYKSMSPMELDAFTKNIIQHVTNNAAFASLKTQVEELSPLYEAYSAARTVASLGGKDRIIEREARRQELLNKLTAMAKHIEILAIEKPDIVVSSGFEVRKPRLKTMKKDPLSVVVPPNFSVLNTPNSGEVRLSWMPVDGAQVYGIEQRAKDVTDWRNGEYTTNDGILLSGYTPGSYVEFKVRTIGAEELKSDWSPVVGVWVA
jgi:hypothetical protein